VRRRCQVNEESLLTVFVNTLPSSPTLKSLDLSPEKRGQILAGAKQVFSEVGFQAASMAQIASAAGVSKGTLYNHFESKEALFGEYIAVECKVQSERLSAQNITPGKVDDVLYHYGLAFLKLLMSPMALAIWRGVIAEVPRLPELGRLLEESGPVICVRQLGDFLQGAADRGEIKISDAAAAAEHFLALCQGRIMRRMELGLIEHTKPEEQAECVRQAVSFFLRACRPEGSDGSNLPQEPSEHS
jgi:TetR/AcrR family transcriptional regulator, mexJK operon transcriptional repressor